MRYTMDFILATHNPNKAKEVKAMFTDFAVHGHRLLTLADLGYHQDIIEDGATFAENAIIKATVVHNWMLSHNPKAEYIFLADDSGLEIDALDKQPGVHSARYLGRDTPYTVKNQKILEQLANVPESERTARFVCVIAYVRNGQTRTTEGILEGRIAFEAVGEGGFGYDPIFFLPNKNMTLAQISAEEKNTISHRAIALRRMWDLLMSLM